MKIVHNPPPRDFNAFVAKSPKGHILQTCEWGEVKRFTGWEPLRLAVEEKGEYKAAALILKRRLPLFGRSLFYAPRGPVMDFRDHAAFDLLSCEVRKLAGKHRAILLKIDPDLEARRSADVVEALKARGFRKIDKGPNFEGVQPKFVFRLDITRSPEELLKAMEGKTRYNIRLAERKGVTINDHCTKEDLKAFYQLLLETTKRDNFLVRSYEYFEKLWDTLVAKGMAKLFMARYQGEYIAGTLAFLFGDKCWYIYGASANRHREVMPNYALQWRMILWAKSQGCQLYDFRGVSGDLNPANPLYGLYRFKKGFGAEFTEFIGEFDLPFSAGWYRLWSWMEAMQAKVYEGQQVIRRLPRLPGRLLSAAKRRLKPESGVKSGARSGEGSKK